jgi:protoporphyrinogen oxidase
VRLNTEVTGLDLEKREATFSSGETVAYDHLVSTLPLAKFLKMAGTLPKEIQKTASTLRWSSVYNINLGVQRAHLSDKHWIYYPEKRYRFYRVGFPMNFAPSMTPKGCSSMYVEIAYQPGHPPDDKTAMRETLRGLRDAGLLLPDDKIIATKILHIPVAYVTYDANRTTSTKTLLDHLEAFGVHSIGRFGGWKYSYMEEAILEGKAVAEKILGR